MMTAAKSCVPELCVVAVTVSVTLAMDFRTFEVDFGTFDFGILEHFTMELWIQNSKVEQEVYHFGTLE